MNKIAEVQTYTVDGALDAVEDRLHDVASHAVAHLVALGVLALGDQVSLLAESRARRILRAVKGVNY